MTPKITPKQEKLHLAFKYFGAKHREFRNKCIGMLPRILEEKIYEKKGFDSISEYAGKLAGLSRAQVGLTLGLHDRFKDKPALKELLESGKVGLSKLARVASIATKENQKFLAAQVMLLSQSALETLVRDMRAAEKTAGEVVGEVAGVPAGQLFLIPDGCHKPQDASKVLRTQKVAEGGMVEVAAQPVAAQHAVASPAAAPQPAAPQPAAPQLAAPLELLKLKLSKINLEKLLQLQGKGMDINQLIAAALAAREEEITQEKVRLSAEAQAKAQIGGSTSRYVKVVIKKILKKEYGDRCAKPGCQKLATQTHHADRFAMSAIHDPQFMAPLCAEHHQIAHSIDMKHQMVKWRL